MIKRRFEGGIEVADERVNGAGVDLAPSRDDDGRVANVLLDFQKRHAFDHLRSAGWRTPFERNLDLNATQIPH